ncbi:hypothetical protein MBRA1_000565 [Malassezia brasiliensis]|uniref:Vesicle transport v-SNARE N-terminal domain-containing protein n=1 Tax=Malassezia brasiliensis TaxID=1821822 RepID=A0AAF0DTX2_9BASI|nr:hypothetical protein MBRA1_000565 [Malassezia brasiliensis]
MAELFESYASDFAQLLRSVEDRLGADLSKLSATTRNTTLQHAESEAEEAHDLLVQMEIEVQSFPQSVRERYAGELRNLKSQYDKLRRELERKRYTDNDMESGETPSQRQRLLQGTSLLENGTERLAASTRLALETEDIGANILQDLRSQREQIEHSRDTIRTPEGTYVCTDWANPVLNRSATQHGGNAVQTTEQPTYPQLLSSRINSNWEPARAISVPIRLPNTRGRTETQSSGMVLDPTQAAQGIDADPADYLEIGAEGEPAQVHGEHFGGLLRGMGVLSPRPSRPKSGMKTSNSTFVTRVNTSSDLGKLLAQRTEPITLTFVLASKTLLWYANIGPRIREPIARVTFSTSPTCIDVNQFTRSADRLDVIVGFNSGDLIWIDPVSLRYSRINKGGSVSSSAVRQVRWLPRSESLFLSAHADGSVFVMDREREEAANSSQRPEPDASWNYNNAMFVSHPRDVGDEGGTDEWWQSKGKDGGSAQMNPVSYWCVSKHAVTDLAFSPTNTQAAITAEDGIMRIVDLDSETLVRSFASYFGGFTSVAWSPDGRLVLTGGQDDLLTLWAPHEGRVVARAQGHRSFVTAAAFDPWSTRGGEIGYRFVSVGEDCCLCFWDYSPMALQRPRAFARGAHGARGETCGLHASPCGANDVFVPAAHRAEVAMFQPTAQAKLPGAMLTGLRVTPHGFLLLHADGQLDWLARPQRPRVMTLATDLNVDQLASAEADDSAEIKSPSRSGGLALPFGRGLPGLRKLNNQGQNGAAAS